MNVVKILLGFLGLIVMLCGWALSNAQQYTWVESLALPELKSSLDAWEAIRSGDVVTREHPGLSGVVDVLVNSDSLFLPESDESVRAYLAQTVGPPSRLNVHSIREIGDWGVLQQVEPGLSSYRPRISRLQIIAGNTPAIKIIQVPLQDDMRELIRKRRRDEPLFRWAERVFLAGFILAVSALVLDVIECRRTGPAT